MTKVVILNILGAGSWELGFPVTLQIGDEGNAHSIQADGYLPGNLEIPQYYQQWQYAYRRLPVIPRINAPTDQERNISWLQDCSDAANFLRDSLNRWLDSEEFRRIKDKLLQCLNRDESIVILIQTEDIQLRRLPWHLWNFVQEYRQAEVVLSASNFEQVKTSASPQNALKILAILGNSTGINVERDREFLMNLPRTENPLFMVEPPRQDITEQLRRGSWDILFFAGHSYTDCETGIISINATESLSLSELKFSLDLAIQRGLKLAIFNSCDGLGLAKELQDLGIPQVIVMREPVPDRVAQNFLKYFLDEFSQGESIYTAVRKARERLHDDWESEIPGVSWLPVICQNPATKPLVWPSGRKNIKFILIASIIVLAIIGSLTLLKLVLETKGNSSPQQEQKEVNEKEELKFVCGLGASGLPTVQARTESGNIDLIHLRRSIGGISLEQNCQEVANRLEQFKRNNQLKYIRTGVVNGQPVICVSHESCSNSNVLLTLSPEDDRNQMLRDLLNTRFSREKQTGITIGSRTKNELMNALKDQIYNQIAREVTVIITGLDGKASGVIVEREHDTYYVLTTYHAIDQPGYYEIQTPDGESYPIFYSQQIGNLDLALVWFNSKNSYTVAKKSQSKEPNLGDTVYYAGYPYERNKPRIYRFFEAKITEISSNAEEGYDLSYNGEAWPGMSGGPLLDERGRLIGIHGKAEIVKLSDGTRETVGTQAIPIEYYERVGGIAVINRNNPPQLPSRNEPSPPPTPENNQRD